MQPENQDRNPAQKLEEICWKNRDPYKLGRHSERLMCMHCGKVHLSERPESNDNSTQSKNAKRKTNEVRR